MNTLVPSLGHSCRVAHIAPWTISHQPVGSGHQHPLLLEETRGAVCSPVPLSSAGLWLGSEGSGQGDSRKSGKLWKPWTPSPASPAPHLLQAKLALGSQAFSPNSPSVHPPTSAPLPLPAGLLPHPWLRLCQHHPPAPCFHLPPPHGCHRHLQWKNPKGPYTLLRTSRPALLGTPQQLLRCPASLPSSAELAASSSHAGAAASWYLLSGLLSLSGLLYLFLCGVSCEPPLRGAWLLPPTLLSAFPVTQTLLSCSFYLVSPARLKLYAGRDRVHSPSSRGLLKRACPSCLCLRPFFLLAVPLRPVLTTRHTRSRRDAPRS